MLVVELEEALDTELVEELGDELIEELENALRTELADEVTVLLEMALEMAIALLEFTALLELTEDGLDVELLRLEFCLSSVSLLPPQATNSESSVAAANRGHDCDKNSRVIFK